MNHFLRRNLWLKLVSLILAYLAWTVVVGRPQVRQEHEARVFFTNGTSTIVVNESPRTVRTEVSGDESIFRPGLLDRLSAEIDVSSLGVGEHEILVTRAALRNVPRGAQVDIIDGVITVKIEQLLKRTLGVTASYTGTPPDTHRVDTLEVQPDRVVVSGPASKVDLLDAVRAEPVDVSGKQQTFTRNVRIQPEDRNISIDPEAIRVRVGIVERAASGQTEVAVESLPDGWRAEPPRVVVTVTAAGSVLQRALDAARARIEPGPPETGASVSVQVTFPGLPGDVLTRIETSTASPSTVTLETGTERR